MQVCALGYAVVGLALLLFVQAKDVFPQLLLARLFFSIGGAATSTMVTAILPTMIAPAENNEETISRSIGPLTSNGHRVAPSISSELTITPHRLRHHPSSDKTLVKPSPTRLAGIVGLFTGCGALLALGLFLPLPELIQRTDVEAEQALRDSYYILGALSFMISLVCLFGLRHLNGEDGKGWRALLYGRSTDESSGARKGLSSLRLLLESVALGFKSPSLGLGYLGGFVARASSVGISLFIPLFVNAHYISSGLCDEAGRNPPDVKDRCREAYVLAAKLTGFSQLVALLFAPIFGFLADRYRRFNAPLLLAALVGALGYIGLAILNSPRVSGTQGSPWIFVIMALLGISQIGAIVCSLGLVGHCVLGLETEEDSKKSSSPDTATHTEPGGPNSDDLAEPPNQENLEHDSEVTPLLPSHPQSRDHLKGSIAGVYSLAGGVGILILTKVGGVMFDRVSPVAPFYMLALFNLSLILAGLFVRSVDYWRGR